VANFEPLPPSRIKQGVTPLLDLVVKRALEKKPAARYASAWEMVEDLRNCLQELPPANYTSPGIASSPVSIETTGASSDDKTVVLNPAAEDNTLIVRRLSAEVDTSNRLTLSRRFDSAAALARMQQPNSRDHQRLTRAPQAPGLLRRLRHDKDVAWFTLAIVLATLTATVLVLS
jgi:serine/threonine protein kinase